MIYCFKLEVLDEACNNVYRLLLNSNSSRIGYRDDEIFLMRSRSSYNAVYLGKSYSQVLVP